MSLFTRLQKQTNCISAITDGKIIRLENINDQAFANQMVGDGIAMEINERTIYAPCEGVISMIAATGHAFTVTTKNGAEILVHIGLQHNLKQEHFCYHVNVNDSIDPSIPVVTINESANELLKNNLVVVIVVLNFHQHPILTRTTSSNIVRGKKLFNCR